MKDFKNTGKMSHCDALGDPIQFGKAYGWARNDNGLTQVTIGIAEKFTEKGVTLKVISAKKGLYEYDPEPLKIGGKEIDSVKEKVNVKGMILFPIPAPPVKHDYSVRGNNNGFAHLEDIDMMID
jgi:hypothetical protein